jgi:membrane protein implicated in regulation of membrane protease activity
MMKNLTKKIGWISLTVILILIGLCIPIIISLMFELIKGLDANNYKGILLVTLVFLLTAIFMKYLYHKLKKETKKYEKTNKK